MPNPQKGETSATQIGTLARPKNVLKAIAAQVPIASGFVELLNQIEAERTEKRISALEQSDAGLESKLQKLEAQVAQSPPQNTNDWSVPVSDYLWRNVEFAIVHTPRDVPDHDYILPVANGCLVGDDYVLTCSEALELAQNVARHKDGRVIILFGLVWYEFESEPVDKATGLVLCRITRRDEKTWDEAHELYDKHGLARWVQSPTKTQPKWTITPWIGQEFGFLVTSDSDDISRQAEFSALEFGCSVISHFRQPKDFGLKTFVSAVYSGRIERTGSAAFSRDGTLLGIISDVTQYEFDAGRRAVVKTLIGFPKFTAPKLKAAESEK